MTTIQYDQIKKRTEAEVAAMDLDDIVLFRGSLAELNVRDSTKQYCLVAPDHTKRLFDEGKWCRSIDFVWKEFPEWGTCMDWEGTVDLNNRLDKEDLARRGYDGVVCYDRSHVGLMRNELVSEGWPIVSIKDGDAK